MLRHKERKRSPILVRAAADLFGAVVLASALLLPRALLVAIGAQLLAAFVFVDL